MKILLISYYYGTTASGVISRRVAESLADNDICVDVITSSKTNINNNKIKIYTINNFCSPGSILNRLFVRLQSVNWFYLTNNIWRKRAKKYVDVLFKEQRPDVIYCRSTPVDACYLGDKLKKQYGIPVLQHFSDPAPPPCEYLPHSRKRNILIKSIRSILQRCDLVSYGNEYMAQYVQSQCSIDVNYKLFISPDMASGGQIEYYLKKERPTIVLTYLGNIYGGRNPDFLYEALDDLTQKGYNFELRIYSQVETSVIEKYSFIKSISKTDKVINALADSDILVDLDGDDDIPVFISSKLKDYLLINRPILSITPINSPSRNLLQGLKSVCVVENKCDSISDGIISFITTKIPDECYKERNSIIMKFSPTVVVDGLISNLYRMLDYK